MIRTVFLDTSKDSRSILRSGSSARHARSGSTPVAWGRRQTAAAVGGAPGQDIGAALIAFERQRQKEVEGWTPEHDDEHSHGELATAAAVYLLAAENQAIDQIFQPAKEPAFWPWSFTWWKPSPEPIRNLVKAGALIAAEIDRLLRKHRAEQKAGERL